MIYHYFCDYCGERFESDLSPIDPDGLSNDIPCPRCGSHCSCPDTEAEARASVKRLTKYDFTQEIWND